MKCFTGEDFTAQCIEKDSSLPLQHLEQGT